MGGKYCDFELDILLLCHYGTIGADQTQTQASVHLYHVKGFIFLL